MNTPCKKGLTIPQLEILRVVLADEQIDLIDANQREQALTAIHLILQANGLETVNAKIVYAQLSAILEPKSSVEIAALCEQSDKQSAAKTYPLHEAAREGNLDAVKKLVSMGFSIDEGDHFFGSTPLHMAAMYGHFEVAAFLIEKGADINAIAYVDWYTSNAYSTLDLAIKYEPGTQTLSLLLEHDAKSATDLQSQLYDLLDKILNSCDTKNYAQFDLNLSKLETIVKHNSQALYILEQGLFFDQEIIPLGPILKHFATQLTEHDFNERLQTTIKLYEDTDTNHIGEYFILAKNLSHAFPSGETYHFQVGDVEGYMAAEGHYSSFTASLATSTLNQFTSTIDGTPDFSSFNAIQKEYHYFDNINHYESIKNNVFSNVANTYAIASEALMTCGLMTTSEKLYQLYCAGETLVLPTGWDGHAIDIILNKNLNLFMVANAGEQYYALQPGLNAYNHKYQITADDIYHILMNTEKMELEFKRFYDLGLTTNETYSFDTAPQMFGNCAWYSQQISEKALIYMELTKATGNDKLSLELADIWFNQLDNFQQTSILKDYLAHPSLEISALGDILVNYHGSLNTAEEKERAELILDNLSSPENKVEFDHYCASHQMDMTPQLQQFIINYEMNALTEDLDKIQLSEIAVTDTLNINDIIKIDDACDLLLPLNDYHPGAIAMTTVVAPMPDTLSESAFGPSNLVPSTILPEQPQIVVLG